MAKTTRAKTTAECHWVELQHGAGDAIELIEATEELSVFTVGRIICALAWCVTWAMSATAHWRRTAGARIDMMGALGIAAVAAGLIVLMR